MTNTDGGTLTLAKLQAAIRAMREGEDRARRAFFDSPLGREVDRAHIAAAPLGGLRIMATPNLPPGKVDAWMFHGQTLWDLRRRMPRPKHWNRRQAKKWWLGTRGKRRGYWRREQVVLIDHQRGIVYCRPEHALELSAHLERR